MDLRERLEVLASLKHNLDSRIYSCGISEEMESHAAAIEREAEKMFDRAQDIRRKMKDDKENLEGLKAESGRVEIETLICRVLLSDGIRECGRQYIAKFIDEFVRGMRK